ncbi:MAG: restriction endonuclease subunit S [Gudongella sp.]|nr:restriction endonuclease subunit S [Gudongella sp.]
MNKNRDGYKETEVGWIPEDWEVTSIGDVANFQGGFAFKSTDYQVEGTKLLKIANVQQNRLIWRDINYLPSDYLEKHSDFSISVGDVIIAMTRPIISTGIKVCKAKEIDIPCLLNQRVGRFIIKGDLSNEYLYQSCFTRFFTENVKNLSNTTGQPNISSGQIESIKIPIPQLKEQQGIAEILSTTDNHIEKLDKIIEDYQLLKKGMMQKLLTQGIGHREFKDTEIGRIPKEWEVKKFYDLFKVTSGSSLSQKNIVEGSYPVYGGNGVNGYHNEYEFEESKLVIGRVGAYCGCIHRTTPRSWITDNALYIKEKKYDYNDDFMYYKLVYIDLNKYANQNAQPVISGEKIYPLVIGLPSVEEQKQIADILSLIDIRIENLQQQRTNFTQLKKALMEQLLTGKIRTIDNN